MMFTTDAPKRVLFCFIYNTLLITAVLAISDKDIGNDSTTHANRVTINTDKQAKNTVKILDEAYNSPNKNNNDSIPAPVTDSEVFDMINGANHVHKTSHVTIVYTDEKNGSESASFDIDNLIDSGRNFNTNRRFNSMAGAIAAVTCLSISVLAYIGIVFWRNVLQRNYEAREILLNEDDIGDINDEDMRHFEAACIEIEA